jgi:hypothetical protein
VPKQGITVTLSLAALYLATLPQGYHAKIAFVFAGLAALAVISWRWLTPDERSLLAFMGMRVSDKNPASVETASHRY